MRADVSLVLVTDPSRTIVASVSGSCTAEERASVEAKHAPKIARLQEKATSAKKQLATAESAVRSAPGGLEVIANYMALGRSGLKRAEGKRDKATDKLEKARAAHDDAEAAAREAIAVRDHAVAELAREAERAHEGITVRQVAPKKGDVEVIEIGVAWARG